MNRRAAVLISFIGVNLMACCCAGLAPNPNKAQATKQESTQAPLPIKADDFLKRFGKPDIDEIDGVERKLVYQKEDVVIAFVRAKDGGDWTVKEYRNVEATVKTQERVLAHLFDRDTDPSAQKIRDERATAKKREEEEANRPAVSRAKYNECKQGMSLKEVQEILGPGKEAAQSGGMQVVTWENNSGRRLVVISMTFQNGALKAKSIFD
jgi:hypothetical protein